MRRFFLLLVITGIFLSAPIFSCAEESDVAEGVLVLRKAQEHRETNVNVAVEAYLIGDVLEVTVTARMYATKPRIDNVILVGPKLGRLSCKERQVLHTKAEEEEAAFLTESMQTGLVIARKKIKEKKLKGTLTKELFRFKIPSDKIIPGRQYELRIQVDSMQRTGQIERFNFKLENLPQLVLQPD